MSDTRRYDDEEKRRPNFRPRVYLINRPMTCREKRNYPDEVSARAGALLSLEERGNRSTLWVYKCPHCDRWHLTSKDSGKRRRVSIQDLEESVT